MKRMEKKEKNSRKGRGEEGEDFQLPPRLIPLFFNSFPAALIWICRNGSGDPPDKHHPGTPTSRWDELLRLATPEPELAARWRAGGTFRNVLAGKQIYGILHV